MMSDYSGTPLIKKLGIKSGYACLELNAPSSYFEWLGRLPDQANFGESDGPFDFIHWFLTRESDFTEGLGDVAAAIKPTGMIWVSWPKGTSKIPTDINRDVIRNYILDTTDLVDTKVCAVSDDWSGLKFMIRKEKRKG